MGHSLGSVISGNLRDLYLCGVIINLHSCNNKSINMKLALLAVLVMVACSFDMR